jgi:hypothetical protein
MTDMKCYFIGHIKKRKVVNDPYISMFTKEGSFRLVDMVICERCGVSLHENWEKVE